MDTEKHDAPETGAPAPAERNARALGKLGKLAVRHDPRTLLFTSFRVPGALPPPPTSEDWGVKVTSWPMFENDHLGDCTIAAAGHMIEAWSADVGHEKSPTNKQIVSAYSAVSGYNPKTGDNDNGAVELDVLNYWRKRGIGGHKITAFVSVDPAHQAHVREAVYLFGSAYIGIALPISAQKQKVWDVPASGPHGDGAPGSWGGHAVPVVGYDADTLTVVTWGATLKMTWAFWSAYVDEAYAVLSADWLDAGKVAPNRVDLAGLKTALRLVTASAP